MESVNLGASFLEKNRPELSKNENVEHENDRRALFEEDIVEDPVVKIENYLEILERTHQGHRDNPKVVQRIKNYYYNRYLIKG